LPKYLARMPRISRLVDPQGHGNSRKAASPLESVTFSGAMADLPEEAKQWISCQAPFAKIF
jgi:hypothetical protein